MPLLVDSSGYVLWPSGTAFRPSSYAFRPSVSMPFSLPPCEAAAPVRLRSPASARRLGGVAVFGAALNFFRATITLKVSFANCASLLPLASTPPPRFSCLPPALPPPLLRAPSTPSAPICLVSGIACDAGMTAAGAAPLVRPPPPCPVPRPPPSRILGAGTPKPAAVVVVCLVYLVSSTRPPASEPSPHPPPRVVPSAFPQNPTTAQFHFQCTSDHPHVVATISVSFHEEPAEAPSHSQPIPPTRPRSDIGPSKEVKKQHFPAKHNSRSDNSSNSGHYKEQSRQAGGKGDDATAPRQAAPGSQQADEDEYRCLIVEEPPPTPHDTSTFRTYSFYGS